MHHSLDVDYLPDLKYSGVLQLITFFLWHLFGFFSHAILEYTAVMFLLKSFGNFNLSMSTKVKVRYVILAPIYNTSSIIRGVRRTLKKFSGSQITQPSVFIVSMVLCSSWMVAIEKF